MIGVAFLLDLQNVKGCGVSFFADVLLLSCCVGVCDVAQRLQLSVDAVPCPHECGAFDDVLEFLLMSLAPWEVVLPLHQWKVDFDAVFQSYPPCNAILVVSVAFVQAVTFSVFEMAVVTWAVFLAFYPADFYSIDPQSHGNV